jgi:hypothetical protein
MRTMFPVLAALLLTGCAAQSSRNIVYADRHELAPVAAVALVFNPPVTDRIPHYDFDREERQPQAYVGYEESVATFFYTRTDDHQLNFPSARSGLNWGNNGDQGYFERESVSETVGVRYR